MKNKSQKHQEKQLVTYQTPQTQLLARLSLGALEAREAEEDVFEVLREKTVSKEFYAWQNFPPKMRN